MLAKKNVFKSVYKILDLKITLQESNDWLTKPQSSANL